MLRAIVILPEGIVIRCSFASEQSQVAVPPEEGEYVCAVGLVASITGFTIVGFVPNTRLPVPVSSLITPANSDELVAANAESLFVVKAVPDGKSADKIRDSVRSPFEACVMNFCAGTIYEFIIYPCMFVSIAVADAATPKICVIVPAAVGRDVAITTAPGVVDDKTYFSPMVSPDT